MWEGACSCSEWNWKHDWLCVGHGLVDWITELSMLHWLLRNYVPSLHVWFCGPVRISYCTYLGISQISSCGQTNFSQNLEKSQRWCVLQLSRTWKVFLTLNIHKKKTSQWVIILVNYKYLLINCNYPTGSRHVVTPGVWFTRPSLLLYS